MSLDIFFEHFEHLAETPNGVQKLRELILQLAVQGKLVPQNPNDEPASVLLEQIKKARLNGQQKLLVEDAPELDTTPYELPVGWVWTRLADIGQVNPRNAVEDNLEVSFVPMALVPAVYGEPVRSEIRRWSEVKKGFTHFAEGDVVLAKITPCFQNGKAAVMRGLVNRVGAGTTELHVFRGSGGLISPDYVLIYLKTPLFVEAGISKMSGTAGQQRVPGSYFSSNPFPLPPIEEQRRIVTKVDQLMALCDELEARQQQRREARLRLNDAALDHLLTARDPDDFAMHWQRLRDNFDLLYDTPDTVGKLRQAILQLAVQGKLVPQDRNDEPASIYLSNIRAQKARLTADGKLKKEKNLSTLNEDEFGFNVPSGWCLVRLADITQKLGAGSTPLGGKSVYTSTGVKFIRSQNVWNSGLRLNDVAFIPNAIHQKMSGTHIERGDILLNITGASIGRSAVVPDDFDEGNVSQHVAIVRLVDKALRGYIHLCLISPYIQTLIMSVQVGISREGLSMARLQEFVIPLPPLAEQCRIVAKVEQLMALCAEIEVKLKQAQAASETLMEVVVGQVVEHDVTAV